MNLNLSAEIISPEDLKGTIAELKDYSKWLNKNAIKLKVTKKHAEDRPELSDAAADLLKQWLGDKEATYAQLDKLIYELEQRLSSIPTLRITLAALPTMAIKREFTKWFRENLSPELLIDFRYSSTLLGGMVVNCGSHIYDWSFRRQLISGRDKFRETMRSV